MAEEEPTDGSLALYLKEESCTVGGPDILAEDNPTVGGLVLDLKEDSCTVGGPDL